LAAATTLRVVKEFSIFDFERPAVTREVGEESPADHETPTIHALLIGTAEVNSVGLRKANVRRG
jgi:hypothetical protein